MGNIITLREILNRWKEEVHIKKDTTLVSRMREK